MSDTIFNFFDGFIGLGDLINYFVNNYGLEVTVDFSRYGLISEFIGNLTVNDLNATCQNDFENYSVSLFNNMFENFTNVLLLYFNFETGKWEMISTEMYSEDKKIEFSVDNPNGLLIFLGM